MNKETESTKTVLLNKTDASNLQRGMEIRVQRIREEVITREAEQELRMRLCALVVRLISEVTTQDTVAFPVSNRELSDLRLAVDALVRDERRQGPESYYEMPRLRALRDMLL